MCGRRTSRAGSKGSWRCRLNAIVRVRVRAITFLLWLVNGWLPRDIAHDLVVYVLEAFDAPAFIIYSPLLYGDLTHDLCE